MNRKNIQSGSPMEKAIGFSRANLWGDIKQLLQYAFPKEAIRFI